MQIRGNGSIIPLEKKSRYKCRKWRLFVMTECGKKTRVFNGKWTDAQNALEAFKSELSNQVANSDTFAAYTLSWLAYRENLGTFSPGTIANNRREINALNRSALSTLSLADITPQDCRDALVWIKQNPVSDRVELSNTTMNKIYTTLNAILSQAVDDNELTANPMERIKAPKPDTKEREFLTPEKLFTLTHHLQDLTLDGRVMALYFICLLGLRRGEVCALYDSDVRKKTLTVRRAIKERDGTIGEPKTKASIRTLPMPPLLAYKVDEWRQIRDSNGFSDALTLCCNTRGGVLRPQLLQRWWTGDAVHNGICEYLNCHGITLHQLRHSNLSMMARYMSAYDLQRYAGWSNIEPANIYVHSDSAQIETAIKQIYGKESTLQAH